MKKIYVNCGGSLDAFNSKKEVMDFFEDCILMSEGSERERYTEIYFSVKENLNTSNRCFTDGSDFVIRSNIDPNEIDDKEEQILLSNFRVNKEDLIYFRANEYLQTNHKRIYEFERVKHSTPEELYDKYISKSKDKTFYALERDKIICIDASAKSPDNYWIEEFPTKDYEEADKWLKGELEYGDYLEEKQHQDLEL